jgi:cytochrome b561
MAQRLQFTMFSRILHWTMAVMILAVLFTGVGMVASLSDYHWLVSIHKPLGILILVLVAIRLVNRLLNPAPSLPDGMPAWQRFVAHTSHVVLYALMFALHGSAGHHIGHWGSDPAPFGGTFDLHSYPVAFW